MKVLILICFIGLPLSLQAEEKALIGRCSFDPQTSDYNSGKFRAGNVVANFYAVTDKHGSGVIVAEGIAKADGFITEATDLVEGKRIDQSSQWPQYQVLLSNSGVPFQASWVDREALSATQNNPESSAIGYDFPKLNSVRSVPASGSFLQNHIVGVVNTYPNCIFWSVDNVGTTPSLTRPSFSPVYIDQQHFPNLAWSAELPRTYQNGCPQGLERRCSENIQTSADSNAEKACEAIGGHLPTVDGYRQLIINFDFFMSTGYHQPILTEKGIAEYVKIFGSKEESLWTASLSGKYYAFVFHIRPSGISAHLQGVAPRDEALVVRCVRSI